MAAVTPAAAGAMPAGGASAAAGNTTLPVAIVVSSRPVAGGNQSRQRQMAKTQHGLRGAGANSFQEPVIVGPNNGGLK